MTSYPSYPSNLLPPILRNDFSSFIHKVFNTINPGTKYIANWHINLLADHLEQVRSGNITRLIINMPPRNLKSVCVSVAFPAWVLGHDPSLRIIATSYAQILSIKHSLDCKFTISADWYKEMFPNTVLNKNHNQKSKFLTTQNGFRFATSVHGSITGEGGDLLIIDDPHKPIDIYSVKKRYKVIEWFEQTFITRLNNKNKGAIIIVMQRLHQEDLTGYLLQNNQNWEYLKIPIIAKESLFFQINDKHYSQQEGQMLNQARDNIESLDKLALEVGKANFAAQYMQEPLEEGGSLLNEADISFYDIPLNKYDYYIQSWDTAIKIEEKSDYSVCLCFGISQNQYYLIYSLREKLTYPILKNKLYELNNKFSPRFILIEDKASGQQLIQDVKSEGLNNIIEYRPKLDKITRFASIITYFQSGKILLSKKGSLNKLILQELTTFPYSKNDDIVDAFSQFLNFMKEYTKKSVPRIRNFSSEVGKFML